MPNKAISLENLKVFKNECDKVYASKNENLTATVDCTHQYEITGNTGDEHGLAIEDQQMLIKKIQGHSRRKSLNLLKYENGSGSSNGVTYNIENGIITLNGTATVTSTVFITTEFLAPYNNMCFSCFCNEAQSGSTWQFWIQSDTPQYAIGSGGSISTIIQKNNFSVNLAIYNGTKFNNLKLYPMLVEGTYTNETKPLFQPYDNTLVNSNNTLISSGRNLVDINIPTINVSEWNYLETITLLKGRYFIKVESDTNEGACIMNIGSFEVYPSGMEYNTAYWFDVNSTTQGQIQFYSNTKNTNVRVQIRYTPTGNVNFDFEPYKQDVVQAPMLGEFDYYQDGKIYRQTSQVVTLNGSENWETNSGNKSLHFRLFDKKYANVIESNSQTNLVSNYIQDGSINEVWNWNDPNVDYRKKGAIIAIGKEGENGVIAVSSPNITTVETWKQYLAQNPIQLVYKLATPTIEDYVMPSGMAVYNGGLQIQQGDVPYTITKQYNLSQKAQILANIEVDRKQAKMIEENKQNQETQYNELSNKIPKFSFSDGVLTITTSETN